MFVRTYTATIKEAGLKKTRMVSANTLLLTNSGATLGVPKICTFETTFNDGIAAFLYLTEELKPYLYWFLCANTKGFQTIFQGADGFPWKACERQKRFASSNFALSASERLIFNRLQSQKHFFVRH